MNVGTIVIAGVCIGLGAFWYLSKGKACNTSVFGGNTSQYECQFREIIGLGCIWNSDTGQCEEILPG